MFIEYDLKGDFAHHKGIIETTGFSVLTAIEQEDNGKKKEEKEKPIYKMWSHSGFAYATYDQDKFDEVYQALLKLLNMGFSLDSHQIRGVGHFRKLRA